MDVRKLLQSCIRRWYVVLPILAVTGWLAQSYYSSLRPAYYSSTILGGAPEQAVDFGPGGASRNGLLEIGGATLIMNMAVLGYDDPSVKGQVVAQGGMGDFRVRMFPSTTSGSGTQPQLPLIMIEAEGSDRALTSKTVELAAAQADQVLQSIQSQAAVPNSAMVRSVIVSKPATIGSKPPGTKGVLVIVLAGIGLAILGAFGVDKLTQRFPRRSDEAQGMDSTTADYEESDGVPPQERQVTTGAHASHRS